MTLHWEVKCEKQPRKLEVARQPQPSARQTLLHRVLRRSQRVDWPLAIADRFERSASGRRSINRALVGRSQSLSSTIDRSISDERSSFLGEPERTIATIQPELPRMFGAIGRAPIAAGLRDWPFGSFDLAVSLSRRSSAATTQRWFAPLRTQ